MSDLIAIRNFNDSRGSLSVIEGGIDINFIPKRIYYIYETNADCERGFHAHKELWQLIVPITGSFEVETVHKDKKTNYLMDNPNLGLLIRPYTWRVIRKFAKGSVCLVLASENYVEDDYIRDFDEFIRITRED